MFNKVPNNTFHNMLVEYVRNNKGRRVGVVVAFENEEGDAVVGWSKCNMVKDKFTREKAIEVAVGRALRNPVFIHHTDNILDISLFAERQIAEINGKNKNPVIIPMMREPIMNMIERADKYFK